MRSGILRQLTTDEVAQLMRDKNYSELRDALNHRMIHIYFFNNALRKEFNNDFSNPEFCQLFQALYADNDNSTSLALITERIHEILLIYPYSKDTTRFLRQVLLSCNTHDSTQYFLMLLASHKLNQYAIEVLEGVDEPARTNIIGQLIPKIIYKCNVVLLQQINERYPTLVKKFLADTDPTHARYVERARLMLDFDPTLGDRICEHMREFTERTGKITPMGGLITCARLHDEIGEGFHPTLISGMGDEDTLLDEYAFLLRDMPLPVRERFVITGFHWQTGDVQIDQDGNISILLIDSLGTCSDTGQHCYESFRKAFPLANIVVHCSFEKRQHSEDGCSVFALDDLKQLHTIDKYLDKRYEQTGLYGYLRDHHDDSPLFYSPHIFRCKLPLKFLRPMQTKTLWSYFFPDRTQEERALVINRKGENAETSTNKSYIDGRNLRINRKLLVNFAEKNADYLLNTDMDTVIQTIHKFTIEGLRARVSKMKSRVKLVM